MRKARTSSDQSTPHRHEPFGDGSESRSRVPPEQLSSAEEAIERAIQSGCGSLLTLQASLADIEAVPGDHELAEAALRTAIDLMRSVIADLTRLAGGTTPSSIGFVTRGRIADRPPDEE